MRPIRIFICAGEVSGDMHAAALIRALRKQFSAPLQFLGFGGNEMTAEGVEILYHTDQTAMVGITPILMHLPFLLRMSRHLKQAMLAWQPDLVLTIDYPGMNLRLAGFAHEHGFKTIHYVCPQVWAWHQGRIPKIAKHLDQLLCFFPFEPALFQATRLKPLFIGHPLVDRAHETRNEPPIDLPWQGKRHRIALLPGSRASEITRILPRLLAAAKILETRLGGDCSFILPAPTSKMRHLNEAVITASSIRPGHLALFDGQARQVLLQAHVAAVASGTATLEASLMRCPTVLVYAANPITAWIGRKVITGVKHIGLTNILAGREVMPELLQERFTAERTADLLFRYLTDAELQTRTIAELDAVNASLGPGQASERAAEAIAALIPDRS